MNIRGILAIGLVIACALPGGADAQTKGKTKISSIKQKGKNVIITVTSNNEFYVGGNSHILHVGSLAFDTYEQKNNEGKGSLAFIVPRADYSALKDGARVYLTYGELFSDPSQNRDEACKQDPDHCWVLGKFSKKALR